MKADDQGLSPRSRGRVTIFVGERFHITAGMSVVDLCVINIAIVFSRERLSPFISRASATLPRVSDTSRPASCGDFSVQSR